MTVKLKVGSRFSSQVCTTEIIIVRAPAEDTDLKCGGWPMVPPGTVSKPGISPAPGAMGGSLLGKRYTDGTDLELLVVKPGDGTLSVADSPLEIKQAKALPSSD
jgi:hypothetical protein